MAVYDLEEQDQLDDLKAWWSRWGNTVSAVIIAACLAIVAFQGWRWWQAKQNDEASALYGAISTALRSGDLAKARDAAAQLTDRYAGTAYATRGALLYARMLFDQGDKAGARTQLQWVVDRGGEDEIRDVARFRLAEVQFDEKAYDAALATLDARHADSFSGVYADLRGDILAAAGRTNDARAAYQTALTRLDAKSPYKVYVQVKLDAIGGAPAGGATPVAGGAPAAPAAAQAAPQAVAPASAPPASAPPAAAPKP
jgi:predicted negative regulator of RcsB-dependent stress response